MEYINNPYFLLALTFVVYGSAQLIQRRTRFSLFNPILVTIALIIVFLMAYDIPYDTYNQYGRYILAQAGSRGACRAALQATVDRQEAAASHNAVGARRLHLRHHLGGVGGRCLRRVARRGYVACRKVGNHAYSHGGDKLAWRHPVANGGGSGQRRHLRRHCGFWRNALVARP